MPLANTRRSYGAVAKWFHWLTALLIVTQIPLGLLANSMAAALRDPSIASTAEDFARTALVFSLHKTLGVAVFFLALLRIAWAVSQPRPGLLNADRPAEAFLAESVHWLLYGSLVIVPLAGWISHAATTGYAPIRWPFGQSLPFVPKSAAVAAAAGAVHILFQRVLLLALLLHVAGAAKHHLIDRDATLRRMLPGRRDLPHPPDRRRGPLPAVAACATWLAALVLGAATGMFQPEVPTAPPEDTATLPTDWQVTSGTLEVTLARFGKPVTGRFEDWTAAITFDEPDAPGPAGTVDVVIETGSLMLGEDTAQALGPDFLDSQTYPTAIFVGEIERTEDGHSVFGTLTLRDRTVPVEFPLTLSVDGDEARAAGLLRLDRRDFEVGTGLEDDVALGFDVEVAISLTARRLE